MSEVTAKSGWNRLSCSNKVLTKGVVERKGKRGNGFKSMFVWVYWTCGLKERIELPRKSFLMFHSNPPAVALELHGALGGFSLAH